MQVAHPRKLLRHAVVAALTGTTDAGTHVEATRVDPNRETRLPAIGVYTLRETVDEGSADTQPRELTRRPLVMIEAWVADTAAVPVDDGIDDLCEQIEAAMDSDRFIGGTAGDSVLQSTEMAVHTTDPLVMIVTLTYEVTYRTEPGVVVLDDFLRAKSTHDLVGGVADTVPAIDEFTVQEPP